MAAVADLERLLERVFERTTARLFKAGVQEVQIERRVERAMERSRAQDGTRISVPARYRVRLHPSDLDDVAQRAGGAPALAAHLAEGALVFARSHGYHLVGRPEVWLAADPQVERGQVEVDIVAKGGVPAAVAPAVPPGPAGGQDPEAGPSRVPASTASPAAAAPPAAAAGHEDDALRAMGSPASGSDSLPDTPDAIDPALHGDVVAAGIRGDGSQTMVFRRPAPQAARAVLRICTADGHERTLEVDGAPLTIGRSKDNALVLGDARVSRHHGRLQARQGALVYTDLASTNGSRVNGIRVDEIVLGAGDRIQVGDTVLVVETLPG